MSIELSAFELSELLQKRMVADEVAKLGKWELKFDKEAVRISLRASRKRHTVKVREHNFP